jgi:hypothetical protein
MASKKDKRDKKKKRKLTDKQLLKLLKALKPQTQQIVRVNVGDKPDKKKGNVQSSYNPPFVFPTQQYPAIVSTAPSVPPVDKNALLPTVIREAPSWSNMPLPMSQQPQLQPLIPPPPAQQPLYLTETEAEGEFLVKRKPRRSKKREEEAAQGYSVKAPPEPRFKARETKNSSLGRDASVSQFASAPAPELGGYSYINTPTQNDRFIQFEILEDPDSDQMGNASQPLPSDQWSGSPEGIEASISESAPPPAEGTNKEATVEPPPAEAPLEVAPAPEETFIGRPIGSQSAVEKIKNIPKITAFGEEEPDWTKNVKLEEILPPTPPEPPAKASSAVDPYIFDPQYDFDYLQNLVRDAPETARGVMKDEIVRKLKGGYLYVPKAYLTNTGRLKTKIPVDEMFTLYTGLK